MVNRNAKASRLGFSNGLHRLLKQWWIGDSQKSMRQLVLQLFTYCICETWLKVRHTHLPLQRHYFKSLDFIMNKQIRQRIDISPPKSCEIFFSLKDSEIEGYN